MDDIKDIAYELEKTERLKKNLIQNFERRKKLNLMDDGYERQIKADIKKLENDISAMQRQIRSIESEQHRKKLIDTSIR